MEIKNMTRNTGNTKYHRFEEYCEKLGYKVTLFHSKDKHGEYKGNIHINDDIIETFSNSFQELFYKEQILVLRYIAEDMRGENNE